MTKAVVTHGNQELVDTIPSYYCACAYTIALETNNRMAIDLLEPKLRNIVHRHGMMVDNR